MGNTLQKFYSVKVERKKEKKGKGNVILRQRDRLKYWDLKLSPLEFFCKFHRVRNIKLVGVKYHRLANMSWIEAIKF